MRQYDHGKVEKKWQGFWEKKKLNQASDSPKDAKKPKFYGLIEFPYPSGDGLHVGHIRSNTAMDIIARKRRAEGYNVLYPIGWDAFGLPTENFAIKTGIHPIKVTKKNTDTFRRQLKAGGFSFDWSREINTTDPKYYKWTQWIFLQLYKKGLAYKARTQINWCPKDLIGLANEEVVNGCCERCGTPVEKRVKEQWMLAITKYADRLDKDLDTVDFLEKIKIQQRNWIGKSEGAEIEFAVKAEVEPTFYQFFEPGKIREGLPFVERDSIIAIVKHWKEDKYLGLKWKQVDWETFITGGIEKGQTAEEAARCEVLEETGYKNLGKGKALGVIHAKFFHVPKNENRLAHIRPVYFELKDGEHNELVAEEKAKHEPVWLTKEEVASFKLPSSNRFAWDTLQNSGVPKQEKIKVFTTRPDTLYGATHLVLAPEHPLVSYFIHQASNASDIDAYIKNAAKESDNDRTAEGKEKTGVLLRGVKAVNPVNGEELPIYVSDYVLATYGTGAIMAVPAHDERDFAFAKKFGIAIKRVIEPKFMEATGDGAPKPGQDFIGREAICAVIRNPKDNTYLCTSWKGVHMHGLVTGGIDDGEDAVEAARREVREETGYKNLRLVGKPDWIIHTFFYHRIKKQNRHARFHYVFFDLENEERDAVEQKETDLHEIIWKKKEELRKFFTVFEGDFIVDLLENPDYVHTGAGLLGNSGEFDGMDSEEAKKKIVEKAGGKMVTTYKLRDWVFSRQRYWGEPIPMVYCEACGKKHAAAGRANPGWIPVPEKDLPLKLPNVKNYKPTETGESPLAAMTGWVKTKCPVCKGPARRETDTMPNWAGSSWYYLRYVDPKNSKAFADAKKLKEWTPVDWYNGGMEHTTLHLLYSRFWHKFLFDQKLVPTSEPYQKRTSHGLILAEGGVKMSKSKGNVVNPDSVVKSYGADTLRVYEMFMGPFDQPVAWSTESIIGSRRFLERVWKLIEKVAIAKNISNPKLESLVQKTIKKVSEDIEAMRFNTCVSALMVLLNELERESVVMPAHYKTLLVLLAPFAPHIAEELYAELGKMKLAKIEKSVTLEKWPKADEAMIAAETLTIMVQVNGKVRGQFESVSGAGEEELREKALALPDVQKWLSGTEIKKVVVVPNKIVNIVAVS